jgi:hypothetical protein
MAAASLENVFICRDVWRILLRQSDDLWREAFSWIERLAAHAWPQSLDGVATLGETSSERRIPLEQSTAMSWLSLFLVPSSVAAQLLERRLPVWSLPASSKAPGPSRSVEFIHLGLIIGRLRQLIF